MSDWAIRDLPRPCAFIQWKGTEVCADYLCVCGGQFHIDSDFAYFVQCHHCNRRYEVSAVIELREMDSSEEIGKDCKRDVDADDTDNDAAASSLVRELTKGESHAG